MDALELKLKSERRLKLLKLLEQVLSGNYDSEQKPEDILLDVDNGARQTYISPKERSTNNYGYMTKPEMNEINIY